MESGLLWCRDGRVLAGIGEAARIPIDRPDGAQAAQHALAQVQAHGSPAGAIAFAAMPFDRSAPGELIVPKVVVGSGADGSRFAATVGVDQAEATQLIQSVGRQGPLGAEPTRFSASTPVTPESWRDQVVASVRERLAAKEFYKVVLARQVFVEADQPIDVAAVLARLDRRFPTAILFAVDGFVGASPELLVARSGHVVSAHPLAGTAPRSSDPELDARLGAELVASTKNQTEHLITIDWLLDNLLPYCSYVDAEPEPALVSLANVHHLGTRVEGRLSDPAASILELVAALHPTPAVGGSPQGDALAVIEAIEPGERGRYAGPVGWIDAAGNGEFAVGIRSGDIAGNRASVWAGCGIVADSDPQAELDETRSKFSVMLNALLQP